MHPAQLTAATPIPAGNPRRVVAWLLLSLALHLLFLLWPMKMELSPLPWQQLRVVLAEQRGDANTAAHPGHKEQAAVLPHPVHPTPRPALRRSPAESPPSIAKAIATTPTPSTEAVAKTAAQGTQEIALEETQEDGEALIVQLQQAMERHFHYPAMAKRHGWQGEVLLSFRLASDGRIVDAHIARSSGYTMLDRAALASLQQVGAIASRLPLARQLELPVIYRLQEG